MTPSPPASSLAELAPRVFNRSPNAPRLVGLRSGSRAFLAAKLILSQKLPLVLVTASDDESHALAADLEVAFPALGSQNAEVLVCPTWEQSPSSAVSPSIVTRHARLRALSRVCAWMESPAISSAPRALIVSFPAFVQASLPLARFRERRLRLECGKDSPLASREAWTQWLSESGYLRVETVEDPGTFALRGDLIDLFPPDQQTPLRLELFDTALERIREFDPESQVTRPKSERSHLVIAPAREILMDAETAASTRAALKAWADDRGIPRPVRDPVLSQIHPGVYPDHADTWAPFSYARPESLAEWTPREWPVFCLDSLAISTEWSRLRSEEPARAESAAQHGVLTPAWEQLFRGGENPLALLEPRISLWIDSLEGDPGSVQVERLQVEPPSSFLPKLQGSSPGSKESAIDTHTQLLRQWRAQGFRVLIFCPTESRLTRLKLLLEERSIPTGGLGASPAAELTVGALSEGFYWVAEGWVVCLDSEFLGTPRKKAAVRARNGTSAARQWAGLQALSDLQPGDRIVHIDHGIGRYQGLVRLDASGGASDYLILEYAQRDKLYLPVYRLDQIQKYAGAEGESLDRLGSGQFEKEKAKVRDAVKKLAIDLVQLYAERAVRPGMRLVANPLDLEAFSSSFPFEETPDQTHAILAIQDDLGAGKAMDRLVCGDVGFGKTEIAIRAAFVAANAGKQVAVLVPTTILALQHEQSFRARFKDLPIRIESISRFKTAREQKRLLSELAEGKIDILIGTHRLLSKDATFRDLGLLIIDEEHRFGVEHKEKLKAFRANVHVLTLTATPIPRTLHLALSGLRDISVMSTPPVDRLPIRTYVSKFEEEVIQRALLTELARGGQVFFLSNRVEELPKIAEKLRELAPGALVGIAHGQMPEGELERAMLDFYEKRTQILLCTTIIESGLDVPSANTIIVNRADTFGLAQLYQIRGRVGRGQQRAYAYLLIPEQGFISEDARKRLEVIQRFVELGSGFSIANHDLEIRGGGDLLGAHQSGHIASVGFELYTELLEEAIQELRLKQAAPEPTAAGTVLEVVRTKRKDPEIRTPYAALLPEEYVPDTHQRLSLYRRLSGSVDDAELQALEQEIRDRFGPLPEAGQNLLWIIRIKHLLRKYGIGGLTVSQDRVTIAPGETSRLEPPRAIALIAAKPADYQLHPDSKFSAKIPTRNPAELLTKLEALLERLVSPVVLSKV